MISGPLIIRIGFWGILYHNYKQEPPNKDGNYSNVGPYISLSLEVAFEDCFLVSPLLTITRIPK